jgi:diaminopimelate decarboxylase
MADARVDAIVERCFPASDTTLRFAATPVAELAAAHGTPLYVYDRTVLEQSWQRLRDALPAEVAICYSIKANPNPSVVGCFLQLGARLEVASDGELRTARRAGCAPEHILFAGPGKTTAELELALREGIGEIHVESELECRRIGELCRSHGVDARVAIRVNPGESAQGGAMRMGGKPAPFGIDEELLDSVVDLILADPNLDLAGVHIFAGTQILDYQVLGAQYAKCLAIAERVMMRAGAPLRTIDFGGGLGIPYFEGEQPLDIDAYRKVVGDLLERALATGSFDGTQFLVEPGRYLIGEAGVYVSRVTDVKVSRGKKFVVVDGGMHHHLAASGNLGQVIKRNYPIGLVEKLGDAAHESVDIVGPLCTPLDVLARNVEVPDVEVGDLVGVFQSGAYALSASPQGFLSRQSPAEVLIESGQANLVRERA